MSSSVPFDLPDSHSTTSNPTTRHHHPRPRCGPQPRPGSPVTAKSSPGLPETCGPRRPVLHPGSRPHLGQLAPQMPFRGLTLATCATSRGAGDGSSNEDPRPLLGHGRRRSNDSCQVLSLATVRLDARTTTWCRLLPKTEGRFSQADFRRLRTACSSLRTRTLSQLLPSAWPTSLQSPRQSPCAEVRSSAARCGPNFYLVQRALSKQHSILSSACRRLCFFFLARECEIPREPTSTKSRNDNVETRCDTGRETSKWRSTKTGAPQMRAGHAHSFTCGRP